MKNMLQEDRDYYESYRCLSRTMVNMDLIDEGQEMALDWAAETHYWHEEMRWR